MDRASILNKRIRFLLLAFVVGVILSGLTAFPLRWEVNNLARLMGATQTDTVDTTAGLLQWVVKVRNGLNDAYGEYPFIAYGTDWLAFGHLVIALAFIGPLRDPVRNVWVIEWGMLACVAVIPTALICGAIRDIPFYHRLIDCCFGIVGIAPLWVVRRDIRELSGIGKKA